MNQPAKSKARSWEQGSGTVLSLGLIALALLLSGVIWWRRPIAAPLKLKAQLTWPPWLVLKHLMIH